MFLVRVQRGLVGELGIQDDVVGRFQPRLGQHGLELEDAGHDVGASVEHGLHLDGIGGAVGALGVFLQFPDDDVFDHGVLFNELEPCILHVQRGGVYAFEQRQLLRDLGQFPVEEIAAGLQLAAIKIGVVALAVARPDAANKPCCNQIHATTTWPTASRYMLALASVLFMSPAAYSACVTCSTRAQAASSAAACAPRSAAMLAASSADRVALGCAGTPTLPRTWRTVLRNSAANDLNRAPSCKLTLRPSRSRP